MVLQWIRNTGVVGWWTNTCDRKRNK